MFKNIVSLACVLLFACLVTAITLPSSPLSTRIYMGGAFTKMNGTTYNNIAYYDLKAASIIAMSNGTDGEVKVVNVDVYGNVYIGGSFTQVGTLKTGPVAIWNVFTNSWLATGMTSDKFSAGSVVTALDTDCTSLPTDFSYEGMFPCDIFVGGKFTAKVTDGSTATNIMYFRNKKTTWNAMSAFNVTSVSVIAKNEFQLFTASKVYIGGEFYDASNVKYSFAVYDTDALTWLPVDGPTGVTDIYYNPNVFSTDDVFVSAASFKETTCKGVCNWNHKTGVWSAGAGSVTAGSVNKLRYIKGLSASNVGSVFIGGNGLASSTVKRRDGDAGEYAAIGSNGPTETVLGMDICGLLSQYSVTGCKSGSVAIGGQNMLKFYDANTNLWRSLLSETGYVVNSIYIKTSSAVTSTVSFALMALVAIVCLFF